MKRPTRRSTPPKGHAVSTTPKEAKSVRDPMPQPSPRTPHRPPGAVGTRLGLTALLAHLSYLGRAACPRCALDQGLEKIRGGGAPGP